jgi:hypothetical protein
MVSEYATVHTLVLFSKRRERASDVCVSFWVAIGDW